MKCTPATKDDTKVHSGRPSGGLAFIYSTKLSRYVTHLSVPESSRVQGLQVNLPGFKAVFINVYFPNDPKTIAFDDTTLLKTLQDIQYLTDKCGNEYKVVVLGDLNADFSRNTGFVHTVRQYLIDNNMTTLWDKFDVDFTFCHSQCIGGHQSVHYSTIDHFVADYETLDDFSDAQVLHLSENISNHEPPCQNASVFDQS